jgi:1,2-diacylglycerol 3-beta-glucosyltransferase
VTRADGSRARLHHGVSLVLLVPNMVLGLVGAYLATLTAAAWRALSRGGGVTSTHDHARHRFIVAIAAHDEERVLGQTLDSLAAAEYPTSLYAVHVVADNCTDATVEVACRRGVDVHERLAPEAPGKGPALTWLLDRLRARDEPHDAVVIIDADTVVSPSFLRVMDAKLSRGDRVIQGYYAVRDPDSSWVVALRYAALAVRHYLRPLARTSLGSSAGLHGNGMVLAADVMRGRRWSAHLTEDIEFEAELLLDGERVTFAPDAVIEAEMPRRLEEARTQHARWERGRLEVARRYVPRLLRAAWRGGPTDRITCADAAVDHLIPQFSMLALVTAPAVIASLVLWTLRRNALSRANLGLAVSAALVQGAYLASGLRMVGAPATVWRALLRAPRFVVWKAGVLMSAARPGAAVPWIRTARNS